MSNVFRKNFHLFFSKLKCLPAAGQTPSPTTHYHDFPDRSNSDCYFTPNPLSVASSSTADGYLSSSDDDSVSDLTAILASQRFFFSSPGRSNSIFESSGARRGSHDVASVAEGVKVPKYSVDPYADFRRSMQEMIEARAMENVRSDWEYLRELLSCYLRLNPKDTHKFIISAFSDLVLCLLATSPTPAADHPKSRRKYAILR